MTPLNNKKPLLERAVKIAKMLVDATQMDRYHMFVDVFTQELKKL